MALALLHIGMARAGSTWLHRWLTAHPELAAPFKTQNKRSPGKDPFRWNHNHRPEHPFLSVSPEDYRAAVESVPRAVDITDTGSYMTVEQIAAFKAEHPDVPITYTVRDPVETLWSHMRWHKYGLEDLNKDPRLLANVRWGDNLRRWREGGFEPHVIPFERILTEPVSVLYGIAEMIGIDPSWWGKRAAEVREAVNVQRNPAPLTPEMRCRLIDAIGKAA